MNHDLSPLQKKPNRNGILRLILSLRTGLTTKHAEDVKLILRNLSSRLGTPSQWQLAKNNGFFELLAASLYHRNVSIHRFTFAVVMKLISNLSQEAASDNASLPTIICLVKLGQEYTENSHFEPRLYKIYFKTIAQMCSMSLVLRNAFLKAVDITSLNRIKTNNLSFETLTYFSVAIQTIASHGEHNSLLTSDLFEILVKIALAGQFSCTTSTAIIATVRTILRTLPSEDPLQVLHSSTLFAHFSRHVILTNCDSACTVVYFDFVKHLFLESGGKSHQYFIDQYGFEVLHVTLTKQDDAAVVQACTILAELFTGSSNQVSLIVHHNLLSPLVLFLAHDQNKVRQISLKILYKFMAVATFGQWYQAVQLGFTIALLIPLSSPDTSVIIRAINVCSDMMTSARKSEIDFYVLQRLLHDGIRETFLFLKFHENETVAKLSGAFFDNYFREEYVEDESLEESSF